MVGDLDLILDSYLAASFASLWRHWGDFWAARVPLERSEPPLDQFLGCPGAPGAFQVASWAVFGLPGRPWGRVFLWVAGLVAVIAAPGPESLKRLYV